MFNAVSAISQPFTRNNSFTKIILREYMYDILFVKVLLLLLSVPTRVDQILIFGRCLKLSLRISGDSLGTLHVTVCDTGRL